MSAYIIHWFLSEGHFTFADTSLLKGFVMFWCEWSDSNRHQSKLLLSQSSAYTYFATFARLGRRVTLELVEQRLPGYRLASQPRHQLL